MEKVEVVTVFLVFEGKVALFKRSDKVRTYKGLYAAVSGYLEGDPLEQARVEIEEETGLTPYEYALVRCGRLFMVADEDLAIEWQVHPFLCEIVNPESIRLDREHVEVIWVSPDEIGKKKTVPGLAEAFRAVSRYPLKMQVLPFVEELCKDRDHGARELALKSFEFLKTVAAETNAAGGEVLLGDFEVVCSRIGRARPSMVIIATAMELFMREIRKLRSRSLDETLSAIEKIADRHMDEMQAAVDGAVALLQAVVPRGARIMIHSFSSSVAKALAVLRDLECSLVVTEARPGFEGRRTAVLAADLGMPVTMITDAAAGSVMADVDLCLMGVDGIELDGTVVNKTGSAMIAAAAYEHGVKVYFLGETRKINLSSKPIELEEMEDNEIWKDAPEGLLFRNIYFDTTQPKYISGILLETGVVESYQIRMTVEGQLGRN